MYNPFSLSDKHILVTGSSSGIGRSCAIEISKMGAKLIITGRNEERLHETFNMLEGEGHKSIVADLTDNEGLEQIVNQVEKLDGIVLNAGVNPKKLVKFIRRTDIDEVLSINFVSPVLLTQGLLRKKKINRGASIVFMSSISTDYASISNSLYSASKGGIDSFMRVLALEVASQKIRVNAIHPGMVKTQMMDAYAIKEELEAWKKQYPLGRFGEPEDIAYACVYLLSESSKWMTGSVLTIDGGITLR
jgi:NAD(P)-dependent dehydrogenase (short-subunit alcohol dehydrogenase family)